MTVKAGLEDHPAHVAFRDQLGLRVEICKVRVSRTFFQVTECHLSPRFFGGGYVQLIDRQGERFVHLLAGC